jgi:hypothetical protein
MKFKMNTKTMTPHDAAGKFFPEFSSFVIKDGDKEIVGHCVLDMDDRGRAVLSFEKEEKPKDAGRPMQAFRR